jgi:hypothetical protein
MRALNCMVDARASAATVCADTGSLVGEGGDTLALVSCELVGSG